MDVVVNEDYWLGCEEKWKDKYRVEMIPEVELSAGEKGLWAVILWQALDRGVASSSGDDGSKWLGGGGRCGFSREIEGTVILVEPGES